MGKSAEKPQPEIISRIRLLIAKHTNGNEKAFADMIGVNRNTFGFWMRDNRPPSLESLIRIIEACKVDATWLLTGEETGNCREETANCRDKLKEARDHIKTLKKLVRSLEKQIE